MVYPNLSNVRRAVSSNRSSALLTVALFSPWDWLRLRQSRADENSMEEDGNQAKHCHRQSHGFEQPLPDGVTHGYLRVGRKAAVQFGPGDVVQHIDDMCSAYRLRIVYA